MARLGVGAGAGGMSNSQYLLRVYTAGRMLDFDQDLSIMWLFIVAGGMFLKCQLCEIICIRLTSQPTNFILVALGKIACCYPNQVAKNPGLQFSALRLLCLFWLINGASCVDSSSRSLRSRKAGDLGHNHYNHLEGQQLEQQRQSLELLRQEMESGFTDLSSKLSALTGNVIPDSLQRRRTQAATTTLTDTFYKRDCEVRTTISPWQLYPRPTYPGAEGGLFGLALGEVENPPDPLEYEFDKFIDGKKCGYLKTIKPGGDIDESKSGRLSSFRNWKIGSFGGRGASPPGIQYFHEQDRQTSLQVTFDAGLW